MCEGSWELHCSVICLLQSQDEHQMKCFQRKADVNHEIQKLKAKMRDSQVLILLFNALFLNQTGFLLERLTGTCVGNEKRLS